MCTKVDMTSLLPSVPVLAVQCSGERSLATVHVYARLQFIESACVSSSWHDSASSMQSTKFAAFCLSNVLETLSASAMGMAIGSVAPSTEAALVLGPAVMLIFVVFGGLYTNQDDVPRVFRWIPSASQIKTGYDALCKNEFAGLDLESDGPGSYPNGEAVLQRQGFNGPVGDTLLQQGRIALFHWWLTYCLLKANKPKFQVMVEPI
jgi:hypothetical protein